MEAFAPILTPLREIYDSQKPLMRVFKVILALSIVLMALASLGLILRSLLPPRVYQKDFMQEYLLSRAVLSGLSPYLPLPDLAGRLMGPLPVPLMPHPSPHPPPAVLLSLPVGLLAYIPAAAAWLAFELLCAGLALYLLLRWLVGNPRPAQLLAAALLVLLWTPFTEAFSVGQLMSLLLLMLVGAFFSFRKGHNGWGGLLLGIVFALKLFAWPVLIYLLLRRNFRALFAAVASWIALNAGAALLMGWQEVIYYYMQVGRQVEPLYRAHERNYSIWSLGFRLFDGTGSPVVAGIEAPPLIYAPALAPYASALFVLAVLVLGLMLACRVKNFEAAFAVLICTSLLVNPLAWSHSLILASLPITIVMKGIHKARLNRREAYAALVVGLLLFTAIGLRGLIIVLAGQKPAEAASLMVPFGVSLLTLLPAVGVLGLLWLAWRVDSTQL
jgi:hypothetical protein